jgi:hypothetical protein
MASRPIRRKRFKILDQLGVEEIADIYIEEATGVRQLMALLFEPERGGHQGRWCSTSGWMLEVCGMNGGSGSRSRPRSKMIAPLKLP